jgi:hypothetical protein
MVSRAPREKGGLLDWGLHLGKKKGEGRNTTPLLERIMVSLYMNERNTIIDHQGN